MAEPDSHIGSRESAKYDSAASQASTQEIWLAEVFKAPVRLGSTVLSSAAYAAAGEPLRALGQAVDHFSGTHVDTAIKDALTSVGIGPDEPAAFLTLKWHCQQLGAVAGMMVPLMGVRQGLKSLTATAGKEGMFWGGAGLAYGSIFRPSNESNVGTTKFWGDRLANGLGDAAVFGVMGFTTPYIARRLESMAGSAQHVGSSTWQRWLEGALKAPITPGAVSGIPGGAIGAEAEARKKGDWLASKEDIGKSMYGMAFVGTGDGRKPLAGRAEGGDG